MLKEERAAIRERYKKYKPTKGAPCWSAFTGACPAKHDIPALLDALNEMEAENTRMQSRIKELNEHIGRTQYSFECWKARAEALERALIKGCP